MVDNIILKPAKNGQKAPARCCELAIIATANPLFFLKKFVISANIGPKNAAEENPKMHWNIDKEIMFIEMVEIT